MDKLKDFIFKLSRETREKTEALEAKEHTMKPDVFIKELARQNGSLSTLNIIMLFMLENKI